MRIRLALALDTDYGILTKCDNYYRGRQPLAYLDPDVKAAIGNRLPAVHINWPRIVVDALEQRLDVTGMRSASRPNLEGDLWSIWQANGLDETSSQAHVDALVYGRAYVMVWAGSDPRFPRITVESPLQTFAETDPATGRVVGALKRWRDLDNHGRAVVFTSDAVVEYRSRHPHPDSHTFTPGAGDYEIVSEQANPIGLVPVVPLVNRARPMLPNGESELTDAMPLADAINKLATDLMVSAEFHAQPRRWVTGFGSSNPSGRMGLDELNEMREAVKSQWERARASQIWIADAPDAKFGQFPEAMLDNFIGAVRMFTLQLSAIAGLPPHYVALSAENNPASADAIRSAEASLVNRARRRQRTFGGAWEDVMRLALAVRDGVYPVGLEDLETVWRSAEIVSIAQAADAAVKLHAEGILDRRSVLEGLDYSPQQISEIA
jgi:hypothetical protein